MKKIHLAFLWHQHQPMYKNPSTGVYELPWVRLHATKDYYDTVAILDEFPKIRSNFNLVPSLLSQLSEYSQGLAHDKYLDITLKPADKLTEEEKVFVLHNFFMANWDTMVYPYHRYNQLLEKRGKHTTSEELRRIQSYFKPGDIRDLQVWFNLSWMDPYWKEKDELVKSLYAKGRDFTEEDKKALIDKQLEICGLIVPKYRQMQEAGQIEVSTTPFYHPILPLLCDTNNALGSTPQIKLPSKRFQHSEDARIQVQKAIDYYQRCFGHPPKGMWPSEGSVSDEVVTIMAEAGIKWIATDEAILFHSFPESNGKRHKLFQGYTVSVQGNKINIIFRDHALSDAIGFVYQKWDPQTAAEDFIKKLHAIRASIPDTIDNPLISVILDGENCWEYYSNDGWDFLRHLYRALSNDPNIETVRIGDFLETHQPQETLKKLWPGSWINGNYGIWIGHTEDNAAWDYLFETRKFLVNYIAKYPEKIESPEIKAAWERIYIAEGSDWNWWYGDDHGSGNDETFDYLFRQNLVSVYELLHEKSPDYLHKAIKGLSHRTPTLEPIDFISPKIDGRVTNYFEWQPAGFYQVGHSGGSMHQVETLVKAFYYGFDLETIFIRIDLNNPINSPHSSGLVFKVIFLRPENIVISLKLDEEGKMGEFKISKNGVFEDLTAAAAMKIIEFGIPLEKLDLRHEDEIIEFVVAVERNGNELERWPYESSVSMPKPTKDFTLKIWSV